MTEEQRQRLLREAEQIEERAAIRTVGLGTAHEVKPDHVALTANLFAVAAGLRRMAEGGR